MADPKHLRILKRGVEAWNKWRVDNEEIQDFLWRANLSGANLYKADLSEADLSGAILYKADLSEADLSGADLSGAGLGSARLRKADLSGAILSRAVLWRAELSGADLSEANLSRANLFEADLSEADLSGADLSEANLSRARLSGANLTGANLVRADLSAAILVGTNINKADLTDSRIYGISAWDLVLDKTTQKGLIITKRGDPAVTVNDIEVAQFIYFMLENKKIRRVIDELTSKAVLILGRFIKKRKEILDALRDKLSEMDYLPIIFDFKKPTDRDFTETVLTLACLSKFVIIDLTDPSSTPHESKTMIPDLEIPFLPIIQEGQREYAMFKNFKKYPWVLEVKTYKNKNALIQNIEKLTEAAEAKHLEIRVQKDNSS